MTAAPEICALVESFIEAAKEPAILDPGEQPLPLAAGHWSLTEWNGRLTLEAWTTGRNLVRRVTGVKEQRRACITLKTERFPKTEGELQIADLSAPLGLDLKRRSTRAAFRERFQLMLSRQFPEWQLADVTVEANLEFSLSPVYARAFLRKASFGMAVTGVPPEAADAAGALSYGLVWLDYLRKRETRCTIRQLSLFAPAERLNDLAARAQWLNPTHADTALFGYDSRDRAGEVDLSDAGNVNSILPICHRQSEPNALMQSVPNLPDGVSPVLRGDGSVSLEVLGLEFARLTGNVLSGGISRRTKSAPGTVVMLAREIVRVRNAQSPDPLHPLFAANPEGWLESLVRQNPSALDASLQPAPIYGQVPVFEGADRGIIDLLAIDHTGRLVVIELKASADIHLPLQALDYWMRVRKHLGAGDFERCGYFSAHVVQRLAPRILLVAPALEFHSTTEMILAALKPEIHITRLGLAADWRRGLRVMFRLNGSESPDAKSAGFAG